MVMNVSAPSSEAGAAIVTGHAGTSSPEDVGHAQFPTANMEPNMDNDWNPTEEEWLNLSSLVPLRSIADGAYEGIRPLCRCGHYDGSHEVSMARMPSAARRNVGRCHATGCDCAAFVNRGTTAGTHTDECTADNDRSAREVCTCPGGPDA